MFGRELLFSLGSTLTLHSFPADHFLLAGSPHFSIPEFRLGDKYPFFIHCAFFPIPTLLHRPHSVLSKLGYSLLRSSLVPLCWLGWDSCSSVGVATKLGMEACIVFCSVPCRKHSFGFYFLKLGILQFTLETEQMSLNMKTWHCSCKNNQYYLPVCKV